MNRYRQYMNEKQRMEELSLSWNRGKMNRFALLNFKILWGQCPDPHTGEGLWLLSPDPTPLGSLKAVTSTDTKPEVVFNSRGRHLEKWISRHISTVHASIWTKFGSLMQKNGQISGKWSKSKLKVDFQYGGLLFFKNGSSYISAVNWDMSTKFGLLIDFDLLKAMTSTNTKPELLFNGSDRHLEKWKWRHIFAVGAPIWTKFGSEMQKDMEITGSAREQNRK